MDKGMDKGYESQMMFKKTENVKLDDMRSEIYISQSRYLLTGGFERMVFMFHLAF